MRSKTLARHIKRPGFMGAMRDSSSESPLRNGATKKQIRRNVLIFAGFNDTMTGIMNSLRTSKRISRCLVLAILLISWRAPSCPAADSLNWPKTGNRIDADFDSASLRTVLAKVSLATGWEIYLEPDAQRTVSVKFRNLSQGEALRRLLADLNFALLPQANFPAKLLIYRTSLQEATQRIPPAAADKHPERGHVIPNELIVTVRSDSKQKIDELARRLGAKVIGVIDDLNVHVLQCARDREPRTFRDTGNFFADTMPSPRKARALIFAFPFNHLPAAFPAFLRIFSPSYRIPLPL